MQAKRGAYARLDLMVILASALLAGMTENSAGQPYPLSASRTDAPIDFDIPAQPLSAALDAYAAATGLEVFYDSRLAAADRWSTAVNGLLMSDIGLRVLLQGTGLRAVYTEKAFTIMPGPSNSSQQLPKEPRLLPYLAIIQGSIERAFCQYAETMPGRYRIALQLRIGASGQVLEPQMLGSTGDVQRDHAIAALLQRLRIERSPPPDLPQPVTLIVSPRPPSQTGDCGYGRDPLAQRAAQ